MKAKWIFASITVTLLFILAFFGLAHHDAAFAAQNGTDKIEGLLLDEFATSGSADFIVMMAEQADLSAADQLQIKLEKGEYVFNTLVATAAETQAALRAYLDGQGADYLSLYIVSAIWVKQGTLNLAQAIAARPDVAEISANHTYQLEPPIDPTASSAEPQAVEPNLTFINVDDVWAMGVTGQGTVMAGNDTGLDATHPAIAPHYRGCLNPPTCTEWDHNYNWYDAWAPSNVVPWDDYGHGTHTTGTMVGDDGAGNQIGVAPGAQTIHCKNMLGGGGDDAHFILCFEWDLAPWDLNGENPMPSMAPDAVNNSWGYGGGGVNAFRTAINNLQASGVLVEVSAGNEGPSCSSLRSPGDYQEVLTTGSIDHSGQTFPGVITGFSSRGPSDLDGNYFPDIMAPGNGIRSAVPGNSYEYWSGTSMAGPHSTALIGLMWSACEDLRGLVEITDQMIRDTAEPLTGQNGSNCGGDYDIGPNNDWGLGTIDAQAAVQAAIIFCGGAEVGYLDGYVYNQDGDPIEGATVTASPEATGNHINGITDPDGYYTMTLLAGTYSVTATKLNYTSQTVTGVEVTNDQVTHQNFTLDFLGSWTPGPALCFDLTRLDAEYYDPTGLVYILGGRSDANNTTGNIYTINPVTGQCLDSGVDMPNPISNYTVNLVNDGVNDLLCTFGGRQQDGNQTLNVQCLNPNDMTVSVVANMPAAWAGYVPGAQVVVDNLVYIFGGFNPNVGVFGRTEVYDPTDQSFTQLDDLSLARSYIMAAAVDGIIYAFGGDTWDGSSLIAQTKAEKMDPALGTWDDAGLADMPQAGDEGVAFGFDSDSPYNLAGQIVIATLAQWSGNSNMVISYDMASNTYNMDFPDTINARRNHAGVFVPINTEDPADGLPGMWVFGGWSTSDNPPFAPAEYYPMSVTTPQPNIKVTPESIEQSLVPDMVMTVPITISNIGQLQLDWSIADDVDWLSEDPTEGTIQPGELTVVDVTFDTAGMEPGVYPAILAISSNDPDTPELDMDVTLTVLAQADLGITKSGAPNPVRLGGDLTYTLLATNDGPDDASGVSVVDTLPDGVTFVMASQGCTEDAGVVTCDIGNLIEGDVVQITIVVTADVEGLITNSAVISGNEIDPDDTNNEATTETTVVTIIDIYLPLVMKL